MIQFGRIGKCVKSSLKVATLPWNKEYHFDEISKIFPENYCISKIKNLQNVIQLGLSFEETVVLKAVVLTFPGLYLYYSHQNGYIFLKHYTKSWQPWVSKPWESWKHLRFLKSKWICYMFHIKVSCKPQVIKLQNLKTSNTGPRIQVSCVENL